MKNTIILIFILAAALLAVFFFGRKMAEAPVQEGSENGRIMGPEEVRLKVDETKEVVGLMVSFHEMVADYRCPTDAQCIEAGAVVARVTLASGQMSETLNLPSDEVPRQFAGYEISITAVDPPLLSGHDVDPSDYVVTFLVRPTAFGEAL